MVKTKRELKYKVYRLKKVHLQTIGTKKELKYKL